MIQFLQGSGQITAAFGDTWNPTSQTGTPKFFSDYAGQVAEPYLVFEEVGESYDFHTPSINGRTFIATGTAICRIFEQDRAMARQLGVMVCSRLNDCDQPPGITQWPGFFGPSVLMNLRMAQAAFVPLPDTGPGTPTIFNRVIQFEYEYQGSI